MDKPPPALVLGVVCALLAYGGFLAVLGARASLWGDEGFTAATVALPWSQLTADLQHIDVNMTVYYAVTGVLTGFLGFGDLAVRASSILAMVAAVALVGRLAGRVLGRTAGVLAAALLLVHPFAAAVALSARPYAMLVLGTAVTSLALLGALRRGRVVDWTVWAALAALLLYVHLLAVFVIAAQVLHILFRAWLGRRLDPRVLVAAGILVVAAVPTVRYLAPADTLNWVEPPTPAGIIRTLVTALGGPAFAPLLALAALLGTVRLVGVIRSGQAPPDATLPLWLLAVPLAGMVALLPKQSLFVDVYLSTLLVPMTTLAGYGIAGLLARSRRIGRAAAGLLVLAGSFTLAYRAADGALGQPQDWRGADRLLAVQVKAGDAVGFPNTFYRIVAERYAAAEPDADFRAATPVLPAAGWGSLRPYELDRIKRLGLEAGPDAVLDETSALRSVWLVAPQEPLLQTAVDRLVAAGWTLGQTQRTTGVLLVHLTR